MASLNNQKIKDTYEGLIKTNDNAAISSEVELTDGAGNGTGVSVSNDGRVVASGTVSFGSLKDTGEDITITKFVDEADGIANNDNDTSIPTTAAVKDYVDSTELNSVTSVNTQTGDVVLDTDNIDEGSSNLYYTEARVSANTSVAANTLKNSYPSADATKLSGIESGADVTDTDNVTTALNSISIQQHSDVSDATPQNNQVLQYSTTTSQFELTTLTSTAPVDSVNGQTGEVVLDTDDVSEGSTNLYYTEARVSANTDVTANTAKNSYPTADATKLAGIEASADVTDATNVAAAGALMSGTAVISDLNDVASTTPTDGQVLTYDTTNGWQPETPSAGGAVDSVNGQTGTVVLDADDIDDTATTHKFTTAADISKLSGIEAGAEVNPTSTDGLTEGSTNLYYTEARVAANSAVAANTAKVGITTQQAADIVTNNAKVGITTQQAADITTNNAKVGITTDQANAIVANTAKVGITTAQADAIVANTAKNSYPTADATKLAGIEAGAQVNPTSTDGLSEGTTNLYYTEARVSANTDVAANTAKNSYPSADATKVGFISVTQAVDLDTIESDVATNNAKNSYPSADATKVGHITVTQAVDLDAIESDVATNNAKVGITAQQASDITANNAKISFDSASSTKLAGIEAGAQVNTVDSVNTQTGAVVLDADDIDDTSTTNKWSTAAEKTKLGYISVTQAVDLDSIEQKQNSQFKAIGLATDFGFRVLSDSGKVEGTQCIMENMENLILN